MANYLGNPNATGNGSIVTTVAPTGGSALNASVGTVFKMTPAATQTLTAPVTPAGYMLVLVITTSGTTSYTLTFGTGFKATATLATGTVTAKVFTITFISDGVNMNEIARTAAM